MRIMAGRSRAHMNPWWFTSLTAALRRFESHSIYANHCISDEIFEGKGF